MAERLGTALMQVPPFPKRLLWFLSFAVYWLPRP
jgi:hypothetical protein